MSATADTVIVWCAPKFVDTPFAQCLSALQVHDAAVEYPRIQDVLSTISSPLVAEARNSLTIAALNRGATWVLYLDADMAFPSDTLDRLLEAADPDERPIVSGLYFGGKPEATATPHAYVTSESSEAAFHPVRGTEGERAPGTYSGIGEVNAVGAGCLLAHRDALLTMHAAFKDTGLPWFANAVRDGHSIGEDMVFCMRANALGIPIHCLWDLSLGHVKTGVVDERTHSAYLKMIDEGWDDAAIEEDFGSRFHYPGMKSLKGQNLRIQDERLVERVQSQVQSLLATNGSGK